jgi:hypothetical protein
MMALSDRSASSGPSARAMVTAAGQSSAAVTVATSLDGACCSVRASIGNNSARISVDPPLPRVSARSPRRDVALLDGGAAEGEVFASGSTTS